MSKSDDHSAFSEAPPLPLDFPVIGDARPPAPHTLNHRERLRNRFMKAGRDALADYELLELLMFRAI